MSAGVTVSSCPSCGWKGLPERLWCPRCGSDEVGTSVLREGVLEEVTTARRARGTGPAVAVGSVRIEGGGALIARLEGAPSEGSRVELEDDGGAAVARAHGAAGV
jgi:uncharacterized OB-fold protein